MKATRMASSQGARSCAPRAAVVRAGAGRRVALACYAESRKPFIGGNWKSNGSIKAVADLVKDLNAGASAIDPREAEIVVAPPYLYLDYVNKWIDQSHFKVAAQNVCMMGPGAYTGEIAAEQLKDFGINWTITGHSERRALFGETNEMVAKKTARALELGINVIPCCGETLDQRNSGQMYNVLEAQLQPLFDLLPAQSWDRVVLAYEPVWAIGTGVVATPDQAQEVHKFLRDLVTQKMGASISNKLRILYGGSVNDQNCAELAKKADIDGFLVGGASLKGPAFITICKAFAGSMQHA